MNVGSLFSGIGGFDLGLERAGYDIAWQVEIDPYCQRVLAKHWPHVTRYGDITTIDWATVPRVDLLCGGFPCQDLSFAGKRAGIDGARSGLWSEYVRAIVQLRPRYVLVENVPGLLTNAYMGRVLGDLAACGYDAEWDCLPASAIGAPHRRDRVWIVAYRNMQWVEKRRIVVADAHSRGRGYIDGSGSDGDGDGQFTSRENGEMAHADLPGSRVTRLRDDGHRQTKGEDRPRQSLPQSCQKGSVLAHTNLQQRHRWSDGVGWWEREPQETLRALGVRRREEDGLSIAESLLGRVAHGIPARVDRLKGLGNAVVPQIVEAIGKMILEVERENLYGMQRNEASR